MLTPAVAYGADDAGSAARGSEQAGALAGTETGSGVPMRIASEGDDTKGGDNTGNNNDSIEEGGNTNGTDGGEGTGNTDDGTDNPGGEGDNPGGGDNPDNPGGGEGNDPGDNPGGGGNPDDPNNPGGTPGGGNPDEEEPPPAPTLMELDLTAYSTDSFGSWVSQLPRTMEGDGYRLLGGIGQRGGQIRLMLCATWSSGAMYWQGQPDWHDVGVIDWHSSNTSVAAVDTQGIVTALSDGEVTITATAKGISAEFYIKIFGQDGAYVTEVQICYEDGEEYGNTYVEYDSIEGRATQFYLRVRYSDGSVECNAPSAPDFAPITVPYTWSISSEEVGYVNADTGNFIPQRDGNAQIYATATGGDPTRNNGQVTDIVFVSIITGTYEDGFIPSSQLTMRFVWSADESLEAKAPVTLSIEQLQALQSVERTFTLTRSNQKHVTDSAIGIDLAVLLDSQGIAIEDISHFRLAANDGANPGVIPADFLFGYTRYYFPLIDWNVTNQAVAVSPMLAYADSWHEGGSAAENYESLNEGTCLRLLFGSVGLTDDSTRFSIKYINTMTVVLNGAPPVEDGNGNTGDGPGTDDGDDTDPGHEPPPPQDDTGQTPPTGTGNENATPDDTQGDQNNPVAPAAPVAPNSPPPDAKPPSLTRPDSSNTERPSTPPTSATPSTSQKAAKTLREITSAQSLREQSAQREQSLQNEDPARLRQIVESDTPLAASPRGPAEQASRANEPAPDAAAEPPAEASPEASPEASEGASPRWQVFEMMNKINSDIDPLSLNNPLEPYAIPALLAVVISGMAVSAIRYRRRLAGPTGLTSPTSPTSPTGPTGPTGPAYTYI
jgi:hypothetical protein